MRSIEYKEGGVPVHAAAMCAITTRRTIEQISQTPNSTHDMLTRMVPSQITVHFFILDYKI